MMNYIVWFDIPVLDIERASKFYNAVLNVEVKREEFDGAQIGVFPHEQNDLAGCIVQSNEAKPSTAGPLIYLNVDGRLDDAIAKTKDNGGEIIKERHPIGEYGHRAIVKDCEGNRIALHSS